MLNDFKRDSILPASCGIVTRHSYSCFLLLFDIIQCTINRDHGDPYLFYIMSTRNSFLTFGEMKEWSSTPSNSYRKILKLVCFAFANFQPITPVINEDQHEISFTINPATAKIQKICLSNCTPLLSIREKKWCVITLYFQPVWTCCITFDAKNITRSVCYCSNNAATKAHTEATVNRHLYSSEERNGLKGEQR